MNHLQAQVILTCMFVAVAFTPLYVWLGIRRWQALKKARLVASKAQDDYNRSVRAAFERECG